MGPGGSYSICMCNSTSEFYTHCPRDRHTHTHTHGGTHTGSRPWRVVCSGGLARALYIQSAAHSPAVSEFLTITPSCEPVYCVELIVLSKVFNQYPCVLSK